ncbi:unnamed protein product [Scytosiphon promiscuus]
MSRPFNTDAGLCIPRMIPWRDWDEWYHVKALLFSPEPYLRSQGVQHVAVWQSRERIPHAVETTSQLVEVRLNDIGAAGGGPALHGATVPFRRSEEELRLIYSAVVVRAVNGLTGHEQKTAHAAPVSSLAREIGLPSWIVDIRHEAAHKQLPGIVTLRLAADFLLDYLWRRYWGPQAEHLSFVWGAFDQLISRYKATSDGNALLSQDPGPAPSSNKRRRTGHAVTAAIGAATGTAPSPGAGVPVSKRNQESSFSSFEYATTAPRNAAPPALAPPPTPLPVKGRDAIVTPTVAMEVAAHEIALSATPTALSWALVSLLADGGSGLSRGESSGRGMGGGGAGEMRRRRGQGHLLPRSRDKYPTPGTPGVDGRQVARRLTSRWATLLDMFHARWRGFGAALLVRLVEALLDLATAALSAPQESGTAHSNGGIAAGGGSSADGGGGGGGGKEGMHRLAVFIEIWVRHLLSRRWHLRASDTRIRKALREEAEVAGLSPAFDEKQEALWGREESAWADEPAPLSVLHAAFFPVRELHERCRRSLDFLAITGEAPSAEGRNATGGDASAEESCEQHASPISSPPTADDAASNGGGVNCARAGIVAVCRALAAAAELPGDCAALSGEDDDRVGGGSYAGDASAVSGGCGDESGGDDAKAESDCTVGADRNRTPSASAPSTETVTKTTMMDLDDLERLLGGDGPPQSYSEKPSVERAGPPSAVAADSAVAAASVVDAGLESGLRGVAQAARVNQDLVGAWELVETWTPCAIGTLPGWSAARLY